MIRSFLALRLAAARAQPNDRTNGKPPSYSFPRSPYAVLGLPTAATDAEVKAKFRLLAQTLHPDMPTGNARKFQEVNAAYNIIKAQRVKGVRGNEADTNADEASTPEATCSKQPQKVRSRWELLWDMCLPEFAVALAMYCTSMAIAIHRLVEQKKAEKVVDLQFRAAYQSPNMRSAFFDKDQLIPEPSVDYKDRAARLQQQSQRAERLAQTKLSDLNEFLLIFDTDHVAERRVETSKIPADFVLWNDIAERCPIALSFDSRTSIGAYDQASTELIHRINNTNWKYVDMGYATALMAEGVRRVPRHSPAEHAATVFEYRDPRDRFPKCAAILVNLRFTEDIIESLDHRADVYASAAKRFGSNSKQYSPQLSNAPTVRNSSDNLAVVDQEVFLRDVKEKQRKQESVNGRPLSFVPALKDGMVQRVVISGDDEMQPRELLARLQAKPSDAAYVTGGLFPVRSVATPRQDSAEKVLNRISTF